MKYNRINSLLIIGEASRNVGKTTLLTQIIKEFSKQIPIVALKIKTIREGDSFFHGKDRNPLKDTEKFCISEETHSGNEDTKRMLSAGAYRVFKIKSRKEFLPEAFKEFKDIINRDDFIVCESNSLRYYVKPALFLFIKHKNSDEMKPSAKDLILFADEIIFTDGKKHLFDFNRIKISKKNKTWEII